ncbi:MAG: hypothetical protein QM775_33670 [Pirellulales bacterium]
MSKKEIKPATPPRDPQPPPAIGWVLVMAAVWLAAGVGHFLLCGICAYMLGDPVDIPFWLKPWDELFQYGISGFLSLLLLLFWWTVVAVVAIPFGIAAYYVSQALFFVVGRHADNDARDAAFTQGLAVMAPVLILGLLSLLILPVQAPHHIDSESGLEVADQISYAAFAEYQFLSMFAMFVILMIFITLFGGAAILEEFMPGSGVGMFLFLIFLSIVVAIGLGLFLGPYVNQLPHQFGVYQATAMIFAGLAVFTGLPMLVMLRNEKKGPVV